MVTTRADLWSGTTARARRFKSPLREFLRTESGGAAVLLAATAAALVPMAGLHQSVSRGLMAVDTFGIFFKVVFLLSAALTVLMSIRYLEIEGTRAGEYYFLILCATLGIDLIHVHNVSACRDGLLTALATIDVPFGYTVHDVNAGCPTITFLGRDGMYCGAETDPAVCRACLASQPPFADVDIVAWRERHRPLIERAAFLIAPSRWAADSHQSASCWAN